MPCLPIISINFSWAKWLANLQYIKGASFNKCWIARWILIFPLGKSYEIWIVLQKNDIFVWFLNHKLCHVIFGFLSKKRRQRLLIVKEKISKFMPYPSTGSNMFCADKYFRIDQKLYWIFGLAQNKVYQVWQIGAI